MVLLSLPRTLHLLSPADATAIRADLRSDEWKWTRAALERAGGRGRRTRGSIRWRKLRFGIPGIFVAPKLNHRISSPIPFHSISCLRRRDLWAWAAWKTTFQPLFPLTRPPPLGSPDLLWFFPGIVSTFQVPWRCCEDKCIALSLAHDLTLGLRAIFLWFFLERKNAGGVGGSGTLN